MNKEVFGVFGDLAGFRSVRSPDDFDVVVEGPSTTVGMRDPALGQHGRSAVYEADSGFSVVFGEAYPPDRADRGAAEWLYGAVERAGVDALDRLNGSFIAVVDLGEGPFVATDVIRSWECFYTDAAGPRVFGSDAAAVARTVPNPTLDPLPTYEFLVLGGALNDRTPIDRLDRLPLDHALTEGRTASLGRYRHDPREFDHVGELASRLERAVDRRSPRPGTSGLLLSAGWDSRALLHLDGDIDRTYTLGTSDSREVAVARTIGESYGTDHTVLEADERYLDRDESVAAYTNGVKESLHVHHAGYTDLLEMDSVVHGLLMDTLLRGYFLPRAGIDVLGVTIPRRGLDSTVDPVPHLAGILGYLPGSDPLIEASPLDVDTSVAFFEQTIGRAFEACAEYEDTDFAALERFGVANVLSSPFRTHLADTYLEGFVAADRELIDWHLTTPPEVRTDRTYRRALRRLSPDILEPRPPDRPHDSFLLNQVEKRARLALPFLDPFDDPWPDRRRLYDASGLDETILPERRDLHGLPPRVKLRIRDLRTWVSMATNDAVSVDRYLPELSG